MKCRFDQSRIERCLVCENKCHEFMAWYRNNSTSCNEMVDSYVAKYPDKYSKEYMIMAKRISETKAPDSQGKLVLIMDGNGNYVSVKPKNKIIDIAKTSQASGYRYLELTGKEYEVVIRVELKQKPLTGFKG